MRIPLNGALLRPFAPGDEQSLAHHANDRRIWRNLKDTFPHPYTLEHARAWIARNEHESPPTHLAIAVGVDVVGAVGLEFRGDIWRHSAEMGYWLAPAYWGRGIMTGAVRAVVDYAFATFPINRLWAGAFEWNPGSIRVLEKAGFEFEARLRQSAYKDATFVDELIYAVVRPLRSA
jgi:[ribosomal protein S5]-alanine N-acetyltransferase